MKTIVSLSMLCLTLFPSVSAIANDLAAKDLVVPAVGRVTGALGSVWRTDLVITNVTQPARTARATVDFIVNGVSQGIALIELGPRQTLQLNDVVKTRFGLDAGLGFVRIRGFETFDRFAARSRVYNSGNTVGEFGQGIIGMPADALRREHFLTGLSGVSGNRSNVGIVNPWSVETRVTIELLESTGESRGAFTTSVSARTTRQFNDIFHEFGKEPFEGALVRIVAQYGVYAYGSVVRSDSGDATFVTGTGIATGNENLLATNCPNPAPVSLVEPGGAVAPGWIVLLRSGAPAQTKAPELAARYGFTLMNVYTAALNGFSADFSNQVLSSLRCEPDVIAIYQNSTVQIGEDERFRF